jgi:predicted DNA-binding transcriptional regulator AlpA
MAGRKSSALVDAARYLNVRDLMARYRIARSTVWDWVQKGRLPKPQKVGPNSSRWDVRELDKCDAERTS